MPSCSLKAQKRASDLVVSHDFMGDSFGCDECTIENCTILPNESKHTIQGIQKIAKKCYGVMHFFIVFLCLFCLSAVV